MIPFRRNVNLVMDKDVYKKLGNQPNTEKAWMLVRCLVGEEIFGRNFVAVPNIESALYYNQLFVFKKRMDPCSMLKLRPPTFQVINNLDNLLNIDFSPWIPEFDFTPWNTSDASRLFTEFRLHVTSEPVETLRKSIEITIREPHVRNANPPVPGSTVLTRVSLRAYFLYVITSVVLANYVKINVSIGPQQNISINSHVIPIGFKYRKYRIRPNGVFDREIETLLKFSDEEATWLSPNSLMILRNPLWDPMGRRHDGRRPTRNILTMSTTTSQSLPSLGSFHNISINRSREHIVPHRPRIPNINPDEMQIVIRRPFLRHHVERFQG